MLHCPEHGKKMETPSKGIELIENKSVHAVLKPENVYFLRIEKQSFSYKKHFKDVRAKIF